MRGYKIFSGSANVEFARQVSKYLSLPLSDAGVKRFSDGEISVQIDESVRGKDVFIIQSTCAPTNDNLMELLILTDALRRSSAIQLRLLSHILAMRDKIEKQILECQLLLNLWLI